jgi:hypothetical protein
MTKYAKILIAVNLALSLILCAWAAGVYGNRIDFTEKGKLGEEKKRLDEAVKARDLALARYDAAKANLLQAEAQRPQLQKWYQEQLALLQTGKNAAGQPVNNPVQEIEYKKGLLQLDKDGRPVLAAIPWNRPQQALLDLDRLGQEYDKTVTEIRAEKEKLDGVVAEEKRLTEEINGDGQKKKGLRKQLEEVQEAMLNSLGEKEFLRRLEKANVYLVLPSIPDKEGEHEHLMRTLYNRKIEAQSQLRRKKELDSRLEELKHESPDKQDKKVARQP